MSNPNEPIDGVAGSTKYVYAYYRDEKYESPSKTVVLLGVGTGMGSTDYSDLCTRLVTDRPILVAMVDHNPGSIVKLDPNRFVQSANAILKDLETKELISSADDRRTIVGGHSAGGFAAAASLATVDGTTDYTQSPVGYFGFDPVPPPPGPLPGPFRLSGDVSFTIDVPSLVVGFAKKSCGVDPMRSARAAYTKSSATHRTLLLISNNLPGNNYHHCVFADHGCGGPVCPESKGSEKPRQGVADAFGAFLDTLDKENADRAKYQDAIGEAPIVVKALNEEQVENEADEPLCVIL